MDNLFYAGNKALYVTLMLSALPVICATVVGLIVAIFQSVTHIQEQTLPFGIKLLAVFICLFASAPWTVSILKAFSNEVLRIAFH